MQRSNTGPVVAVLTAFLLAACATAPEEASTTARTKAVKTASSSKARSPKPKAVAAAKPDRLVAGQRMRQFCGERHVAFQSGRLTEDAATREANNRLCKSVYEDGAAAEPGDRAGTDDRAAAR